jgi:acetyl esterase/lipase
MHIVRPKPTSPAVKPMPVIVWIHGGAWIGGSKDSGIPLLLPFAKRGYFCASISYRFSKEAKFPAQIEDCKCAIRFLRAKAKEFNIDTERIGVWGESAGGHLAAMLGTAGDVKEFEGSGGWEGFSSRVSAVCDWFGPSDLLGQAKRSRTC